MPHPQKAPVLALFGLVALAAGGCGSSTPVGQPSDGGASEADAVATESGSGCTTGLGANASDQVTCANGSSCDASNLCCMTSTAGTCRLKSAACMGGEKELGCTSSNGVRCTNGSICCLSATSGALAALKTSTTCPAPLAFADFSVTQCLSVCTNKLPVCQANAECQGGATCHAVVLTAFAPITFGVCY